MTKNQQNTDDRSSASQQYQQPPNRQIIQYDAFKRIKITIQQQI